MRRALAILAYVLAIPLLGWPLLFCVLLTYKAHTDGLVILREVELQFWLRAAVAGVFGLLFLGLGANLASLTQSPGEE
jgi:hypothetical protein